jgi:hypothetical protein
MTGNQPTTTLRRFFSGLAEYVFQSRLGLVDPPMIDYLSDMMIRFVHCDAIYRVRDLNGRPMVQVTDMLLEAGERIGTARREVHRHIGDFTLFWAGLYPEALRELQGPDKKDHFIDYCTQGKRAYLIAGSIETSEEDDAPSEVLHRLSTEYEMCAYGLREIRREWERHDDEDLPRPILLN